MGAIESREFYRGARGDVWLLAREAVTGHVFVRHEAETVSHMEIGAFLRPGNQDPAHQALRDVLGAWISQRPAQPPAP
jgi:hypothetical protein